MVEVAKVGFKVLGRSTAFGLDPVGNLLVQLAVPRLVALVRSFVDGLRDKPKFVKLAQSMLVL